MIEVDVDMGEVADELDEVVLHDEAGEMPDVAYVRADELEWWRKFAAHVESERLRLRAENERLRRELATSRNPAGPQDDRERG